MFKRRMGTSMTTTTGILGRRYYTANIRGNSVLDRLSCSIPVTRVAINLNGVMGLSQILGVTAYTVAVTERFKGRSHMLFLMLVGQAVVTV
jgi:hypothetical protein